MFACYFIFFDTSDPTNLPMMVGTLYGAVTNTPGLGAANEALQSVFPNGAPQIASGYACAYPLGVVGIIGATIAVRYICRVRLEKEEEDLEKLEGENANVKPHKMHVQVSNAYLEGKTLMQVHSFLNRDFVCSRILHEGHVSIPNRDTIFHIGDQLYVVCAEADAEAIIAFIGPQIQVDWQQQDQPLVSKRVLVTRPSMNGKTLGQLHLSRVHGVNVTRVTRQGMDIFASASLPLQVGDRIMVVGPEDAVNNVANMMGNSIRRLDAPNIATIFVGIIIGIIFGSLPIAIPRNARSDEARYCRRSAYHCHPHRTLWLQDSPGDLHHDIGQHDAPRDRPRALPGLRGNQGWSRVLGDRGTGRRTALRAHRFPHHHYTYSYSRLHCPHEIQIQLFHHHGYGGGTYTDPPALAYANSVCSKEAPAVGYSTVYPLSMFLRILTAQIIVLFFCG